MTKNLNTTKGKTAANTQPSAAPHKLYTLEKALAVLSLTSPPNVSNSPKRKFRKAIYMPSVHAESQGTPTPPNYTPSQTTNVTLDSVSDVTSQFNDHFGDKTKLENWQKLCCELGIFSDDLSSLRKCKKALSKVNVNIFDLLAAQRAARGEDQAQVVGDAENWDWDTDIVDPQGATEEEDLALELSEEAIETAKAAPAALSCSCYMPGEHFDDHPVCSNPAEKQETFEKAEAALNLLNLSYDNSDLVQDFDPDLYRSTGGLKGSTSFASGGAKVNGWGDLGPTFEYVPGWGVDKPSSSNGWGWGADAFSTIHHEANQDDVTSMGQTSLDCAEDLNYSARENLSEYFEFPHGTGWGDMLVSSPDLQGDYHVSSLSSDFEPEGSTYSDSKATVRETTVALDVKKFDTRHQLMRYTRKEKKFYPKDAAKEMGPIRCLLQGMK